MPRPVQPGIVGARHVPLGFGEPATLDAHPHGHQRHVPAFVDHRWGEFRRTPSAGLAADGIKIPALHLSETGYGFPHTAARGHVDRVLGLAEADGERRSLGIMLDHAGEILVQQRSQAHAIAHRLRRRAANPAHRRKHGGQRPASQSSH